jgi:hypothetical protein
LDILSPEAKLTPLRTDSAARAEMEENMKSVYKPSRSLMDFHIAGFGHHEGLSVISDLRLGTKVELRHEPNNPYDPHAVAIYFNGNKIGYVPQGKNSEMFLFLYYGHDDLLEAYINMFDDDAHPERQFRVTVKVIDKREEE